VVAAGATGVPSAFVAGEDVAGVVAVVDAAGTEGAGEAP
jgi:hypothetical protein